jgi:RNA polymerase sigma-70 factor, ECF subfamily
MNDSEANSLQNIEKVFREHHKMLCNVAYAMVRDRSAAEDIVQDVFLNLWRKRNELIIDSNLKGYLYRSVSNSCLNYLQSYHKKNFKLRDEFKDNEVGFVSIHDMIDADRLQLLINNAVDNLPPRCKAVFVLSRYEGMKQQQIADTLNISVKTVENQMGIALAKLRDELQEFLAKGHVVVLGLGYFSTLLGGNHFLTCL